MEQMEEGKEINIGNVDNIICHEELQSEAIHQQHDQNSEVIGDISKIQDSKEVLCQGILLEILEKIFKQPSDPDSSEVVTYNHQNINPNDDEILQMHVEEIIPGKVPSMQENIIQDIIKDKPSTSATQTPHKMTKKVKGKHSE